jgi:regulatory protein
VRAEGGAAASSVGAERPDAWGVALKLLAMRAHTTQEVRQRLARRGYPPDEIAAVISRLISAKYLDDLDFARMWVRSRAVRPGLGPARLARELRAKGIVEAEIDAALAESPVERTLHEVAEELAARKLRALQGLDPSIACRRLAAHLTRRGFAWEIISAVCRKFFSGTADPDEEP